MTEREYRKYNNPNAKDAIGKPIKIGDTVVINNHYGQAPHIGVVDHFTQNNNLAVKYIYRFYSKGKLHETECWAYRFSETVIKIKDGNTGKYKNKK